MLDNFSKHIYFVYIFKRCEGKCLIENLRQNERDREPVASDGILHGRKAHKAHGLLALFFYLSSGDHSHFNLQKPTAFLPGPDS